MEFGKVPEEELPKIDFTLPPDPGATTEVLHHSGTKKHTKFYIGCAKWGRTDWVGKLYPRGSKARDFFALYAKQFNSIEFNGFFYKLPTTDQARKWKAMVTPDFKFCPKFTQSITHYKRLSGVKHDVDVFLSVVTEFGENLGPIFLMPHPQMGLKKLSVIEGFIDDIPSDLELFLELRHRDFYKDEDGYNPELFHFLKDRQRGTIITDTTGRRDCVHMHLSTPECFIRFVGNGLHPTDYQRIDDWVRRIKKWMHEGLKTCYFFMHQHNELHSPELINYFIAQMNLHAGTDIKPPVMYG
jgi:uncharacterized protein YecE (DUF72 family)